MSITDWIQDGKVYELKPVDDYACTDCAFLVGADCKHLGFNRRISEMPCEKSGHHIYVLKKEQTKQKEKMLLPTNAAERKKIPIVSGVLDYFQLAIAEVAKCSLSSNEQHNPGQPLHWDRTKSFDHIDCIGRHIIDRGKFDDDGQRHSAKLAWRALALLQLELEEETKKGNT